MADWRARRKALRGQAKRVVHLVSFARIWTDDAEDDAHVEKNRKQFMEACLNRLKNESSFSDEERHLLKQRERELEQRDYLQGILRGYERRVLDILGSELNTDDWAKLLEFPLQLAASAGDKELATKLVKAGAAVGSATHAAVRGGSKEVVDFLLENGASTGDLDSRGETPLHAAARAGKLEMARLLILKGADNNAVGNEGGTPLYWACRRGHAAVAKTLLVAGADLNLRFTEGELSPLDAAVGFGHTGVLRVLVEHGTDVNAAGSDGRTALYWCVYANKAKAIDLLVGAGANMEARTSAGSLTGLAPLHLAFYWRNFDAFFALLLKHGADANVRNKFDETPLHCAAARAEAQGMPRVVDTLLRMGADETLVSKRGKTPLDLVADYGEQQGSSFAHNAKRVRLLLVNATLDRSWRRRVSSPCAGPTPTGCGPNS